MEFRLIEHEKDKHGSPTFHFQVFMEEIACGAGRGYSKKEGQQEAAKLTLQRLRREPQFIEEIFSAKANRTKMEEEPVLNVPETSQDMSFIVSSDTEKEKQETPFYTEVFDEKTSAADNKKTKENASFQQEEEDSKADEFDLSGISHSQKIDKESIIAAAESQAFEE